jgi:3-hydroxyacyl-CoA dehydrogenase
MVELTSIAVIGAGTMGHGIAQTFALAGYPVTLTDNNAELLQKAIPRIKENLRTYVAHGLAGEDKVEMVPSRITPIPDIPGTVAEADFIIEAVFEDIAIKHEVLALIEANCPPQAIIASNSSSFRVGDMAVVLKRPEQFLGTHFWNPPYLIPLVEVICGLNSSPETIRATCHLLKRVGKYPALVRKDVAGFVGNRLQHALRREAIALVADGVATPEDIDLIARLGFGLRLPIVGPLETVDLAGLDLTLAIQSYLLADLDRSTEPSPLVRDKVARGELGAKTGKGFFEWSSGRQTEVIQKRDGAIMELVRWLTDGGYIPTTGDDEEHWQDLGRMRKQK